MEWSKLRWCLFLHEIELEVGNVMGGQNWCLIVRLLDFPVCGRAKTEAEPNRREPIWKPRRIQGPARLL